LGTWLSSGPQIVASPPLRPLHLGTWLSSGPQIVALTPTFWGPITRLSWGPPIVAFPLILGTWKYLGPQIVASPAPPDFWDLDIIGTSKFVAFPLIFGIGHPAILGTSNCRLFPLAIFGTWLGYPYYPFGTEFFFFFNFVSLKVAIISIR
jgi:hypothetical protein